MPSNRSSALETCIQITSYGLNRLFLGIYVYIYTYEHIYTITEKEAMVLKEVGLLYRRVRKKKKKKQCYNYINLKNKTKEKLLIESTY